MLCSNSKIYSEGDEYRRNRSLLKKIKNRLFYPRLLNMLNSVISDGEILRKLSICSIKELNEIAENGNSILMILY